MLLWCWVLTTAQLVSSDPGIYENLHSNEVAEENRSDLLDKNDDRQFAEDFMSRQKRSIEDEEREKKQMKFHSWGGKRYEDQDSKETKEQIENIYDSSSENVIPSIYDYGISNASDLGMNSEDELIMNSIQKREKNLAFSSWGGKRDPETVGDLTKRSNLFGSLFQGGGFRPRISEINSKRYPAFNSWAGKRSSSFSSWGGKRGPAFNSWGGKRAPAFNSWGGKRATAFNSWGGKRAFNSWGGKRAPAFNSWGGKRAPAFNSWGGKRGRDFISWDGKKADFENSSQVAFEMNNNNDFLDHYDQYELKSNKDEQVLDYNAKKIINSNEEYNTDGSLIAKRGFNRWDGKKVNEISGLPEGNNYAFPSHDNNGENMKVNKIYNSDNLNEIINYVKGTEIFDRNDPTKEKKMLLGTLEEQNNKGNFPLLYLYKDKRGSNAILKIHARHPSFSSWAGKRNLEEDISEKRGHPSFSSWAGKRSPMFSGWYSNNKIPTVELSNGKRRPAFSSWGGKRSVNQYQHEESLNHLPVQQEDTGNPEDIFSEESQDNLTPLEERASRRKRSTGCKNNYASDEYDNHGGVKRLFRGIKSAPFMSKMLVQRGITWPMVKTVPRGIDFYAWGGKRSL